MVAILSKIMATPIDPHLPPIVPSVPIRVAEAADARLPIREHEEQAKRKKDESEKKEAVLPQDSYDQTVLGVRALVDFLKNFVHTLDQAGSSGALGRIPRTSMRPLLSDVSDVPIGPDSEPPRTSFHQPPSESSMSARAASAYRHSAAIQSPSLGGGHGADTPLAGATGLVDNTEIRQIHTVITLLETLEDRGVQGIRLERADTFVTAIENAARGALGLPLS